MELDELVRSMQIVELAATTHREAISELVQAGGWARRGVPAATILEAIEEREATARTVIAPGLALPHAVVDEDVGVGVVLGRSRHGVAYDMPDDVVHLIVLLVVGGDARKTHLQILAAVGELMGDETLRQQIIHARDVDRIRRLLLDRSVLRRTVRRARAEAVSPSSLHVVRHAAELAESLAAQAVLLVVERCEQVPWEALEAWTHRVLVVTGHAGDDTPIARSETHVFEVPQTGLSRRDRAELGLLLAAGKGLVDHEHDVVCVTGSRTRHFDSVTVATPAVHFRAMFPDDGGRRSRRVAPAVILRVLSLAIEISSEGREGHPVGVLFVVGDARQVQRLTRQLVLNPFHGFAARLRNVLDPSLAETIKEFAQLDGAFVIDADGTALSAGTYLTPSLVVPDLPGGLGARHRAAAGITAETRAVAVSVSQSTGTVTMFQNGAIVLQLERAAITRW